MLNISSMAKISTSAVTAQANEVLAVITSIEGTSLTASPLPVKRLLKLASIISTNEAKNIRMKNAR